MKYLVRDFLNVMTDSLERGRRVSKRLTLLSLAYRDPNHKELVVLVLLCNPFFPQLLVTINWSNKKACNYQNVSRFIVVLRWRVAAQHLECSPTYSYNLGQSKYNRVQKHSALCSPNVLPNVHRVTVLGTVLNGY